MAELRAEYSRLLRRADRLGRALVAPSNAYLSQAPGVPEQIGVVQCIFGIRAWRIIRAARRLLGLRIDDPIGILARHAFELAIEIEYLSTDTQRRSRNQLRLLSSPEKIRMFLEYYFVGMNRSGYKRPPPLALNQAETRRSRLGIQDDRAWHGATMFAMCEELDRERPLGDRDVRQLNYRGMYRTLSIMFVHPNFRGTPWLEASHGQKPTVLVTWQCDELLATTLLYGLQVMTFWNRALGEPKQKILSMLLRDSVALARKGHDAWSSALGTC